MTTQTAAAKKNHGPKTRLTGEKRRQLYSLAEKLVACPAEQSALVAAYKRAEPLVRAVVEKKYPAADMLVCQRYEAAYPDDCIRLQLTAGGIEQFQFDERAGPLAPRNYCGGRIYPTDARTTDAVTKWVAARDALVKARKAKLLDYKALIDTSNTLEAVAGIWPEAAQLSGSWKSYALVALSDDTVARIQADVAARARLARKSAELAKGA